MRVKVQNSTIIHKARPESISITQSAEITVSVFKLRRLYRKIMQPMLLFLPIWGQKFWDNLVYPHTTQRCYHPDQVNIEAVNYLTTLW